MSIATLKLDLPSEELASLQAFAMAHDMTVAELVGRFAKGLQAHRPSSIHPEVLALSGLVPAHWDVREERRQHEVERHA